MKITKRQLRRIVKEAIEGSDGVWYDDYGNRLQPDESAPWESYPAPGGETDQADYQEWVEENGHITPASSSVMASYIIAKGINYDVAKQLALELRIDPIDVEQDMLRQLGERG